MLKHRVIPVLLLRNGGLVKTTRFNDPRYIGDPINAIRIFNEKEVDELIVLDISASKDRREPDYALIEQFSGECFMPLTYGGGIGSVDHARKLFSIGVEKICIQSAALESPKFIRDLVSQFGSSSVSVSIDIKRNWLGQAKLFHSATRKMLGREWLQVVRELVLEGAGEVVVNSVDKDGTLAGPDLSLISEASSAVSVPLIALGGVASLADMKACVDAGASAVAAGAFFVYRGPHRAVLISYPKYQDLEELFES